MKKWILSLVTLVTLFTLVACGSDDGSSGEGVEGKTFSVATDANFQPFEYLNPDTGEMEGFDIDLLNAIADEAGFEVEYETMNFDGLLASMRSERHDMGIAGISITDDRDENMDFSDKYYDSGLILAVPQDSDIESIDDVDGMDIGSRQGSTSEAFLNDETDANVTAFPEIVTAYMDLEANRLDAVFYDLPNVQYYIKENAPDSLKTVGDLQQGQPYGIAFPEGSDLVEPVNEALATIIDNGTYAEIYQEWFGEEPPEEFQ
ncbi:transporter substrate-binding domain-containing protein [Alkalibacillus almallahensis]|uniref:transporter substrate-binding domain-containing protein n=1 Tax=Alkalibacillus almallahensis TaxID=1379154 RepID=UPI0014219DF2|nr:transporter substrate-binding domain-containing protein [Alkalibacillus almallahensis]NIK13041.1 glutamine transport system substrate-binding protein [Alkalibacillus almallahensis]